MDAPRHVKLKMFPISQTSWMIVHVKAIFFQSENYNIENGCHFLMVTVFNMDSAGMSS